MITTQNYELSNFKPPNLFCQKGKPSIHICHANVNIVGGQSHIITCSVSSISDITDITWIKTTAVGYEIVKKVDVDGKFSGGTLSDPSLTINSIVNSDEGIYVCKATNCFGSTSSENSVLTFKDEADSLSKQENNFLRFYLLCQKIATQAVRLFFDREVPGLDSFLKQHKSNLTTKSNYKCTWEQQAILFPGGQIAVDSANFDFTLLYKLIRNCFTTIPAPTRAWGNRPLSGHLNETDDIERIRYLRNNLAHNSEFEICDTDFSTHWTDLSQAIDRLSKGSLSTDVESMRTKSFDKCTKNQMEDDIRKEQKTMLEDFVKLQQQVADNTKEIAIISGRHIPLNIRECHIKCINKWKIDDKLFYEKTGAYTSVLNMVKSKHYTTIIGGPGSGKTATARHIALQLEKQGLEIVPVCKLEDIICYGNINHGQVFVLDDVLGIFAVDMNSYNYITNHEEQICTTRGKTSKILFTCRKSVYMEASKLELFVAENIVDLQSKDNQLTETEKMAICQNHCESKGVNPDLYASLSFTKANHMFPFLCEVFSREKKTPAVGRRLLQ